MQEEFEEFDNGFVDVLNESVEFENSDFTNEDVIIEDVMLDNFLLPCKVEIEEDEHGIFDDVYNFYEKPHFKDRLFFYPFIFISFATFASTLLLLVNLCNIF